MGLAGSLPEELFLLSKLEALLLQNEEGVRGFLPPTFGTNATEMRVLVLQNLELTGAIPDGYLGNSPMLQQVHLDGNALSGDVPMNLGGGSVVDLDLGGNRLRGSLSSFESYGNLTSLSLSGNIIDGEIPDEFYGSLPKLQFLDLSDNENLTGGISPMIEMMPSLTTLRLGGTQLGGGLPDELYFLENLKELDLSDASFGGPLSATFGLLSDSLQILALDENEFSGTVPKNFGLLSTLGTSEALIDRQWNRLCFSFSHIFPQSPCRVAIFGGQ